MTGGLIGNPNAAAGLGTGLSACAALGGSSAGDLESGAGETFTASILMECLIPPMTCQPQHLPVGWLDPVGLCEGFDSFRIDIEADGMTLF